MNNLLKDLKAVALLADKATPGEWVTTVGHHVKQAHGVMVVAKNELRGEVAQHNAAYIATLHNFIRTHHAEIADALADARRYRALMQEIAVLRDASESMESAHGRLVLKLLDLLDDRAERLMAGWGFDSGEVEGE